MIPKKMKIEYGGGEILKINIFDVWQFEIDWKAVSAIALAVAIAKIFA